MSDDSLFILLHRVIVRTESHDTLTTRIAVDWDQIRSFEELVIKPTESIACTAIEFKDNTSIIVTETYDEVLACLDHHVPLGFSPKAPSGVCT